MSKTNFEAIAADAQELGRLLRVLYLKRGTERVNKDRRYKMLVAIGNYGFINLNEVEAVLPPESAPIKRMVIAAKDNGTCVDMTYGRRTKSVIVLRTGKIVLSSTLPDTLSNRMNNSSKK